MKTTISNWIAAGVLLACTIFLGFVPEQSDFLEIVLAYLPFFAAYAYVIRMGEKASLKFWLGIGLLARLILLFSFPRFSDDVYRFIWDGRLLINGLNPFDHLPAYYLEAGHQVPGLEPALYEKLNSPEYFTIYPPVAQATFALACSLFPNSISGSAFIMKLFLLLCEAGTIFLLPRILNGFKLPRTRSLIYALNPLLIVEIVGNLHYEGAMIFFLVLGLYLLQKERYGWAAVAIALSIAAKLLPLLFLPFFIRRLGWKRSIRFFAVMGGALVLLFLPLVNGVFLQNFGNSLDLYFRKFEFNGSIYYLLRWIGFRIKGYNTIAQLGPWLAFATFTGISLAAILDKDQRWRSLPGRALFAICLYLFFTTTVHPWYVALPVVLCMFTNWRFPLLWSALIILTYVNYSYPGYFENLWVVSLEYLLVFGFLIWEIRYKRIQFHLSQLPLKLFKKQF
ncbi:MAG: glycosyltransferase 87 family protein [Saprospiraceae bacterium]|nr:hypothetical protein [Lewinella sp.]